MESNEAKVKRIFFIFDISFGIPLYCAQHKIQSNEYQFTSFVFEFSFERIKWKEIDEKRISCFKFISNQVHMIKTENIKYKVENLNLNRNWHLNHDIVFHCKLI